MGDRGFACAAGFAFAVVNEQSLFEIAGFAIGFEEITEGGAALGDGFGEDFLDGGDEF